MSHVAGLLGRPRGANYACVDGGRHDARTGRGCVGARQESGRASGGGQGGYVAGGATSSDRAVSGYARCSQSGKALIQHVAQSVFSLERLQPRPQAMVNLAFGQAIVGDADGDDAETPGVGSKVRVSASRFSTSLWKP